MLCSAKSYPTMRWQFGTNGPVKVNWLANVRNAFANL